MSNGNPPRKVDKLRAFMAADKWRQALSLAASWPELGAHRDLIKQAASAALSPRFYSSMGKDPDALVAAGIAALKERYAVGPCVSCKELTSDKILVEYEDGYGMACSEGNVPTHFELPEFCCKKCQESDHA